jgi:hypothetical protein
MQYFTRRRVSKLALVLCAMGITNACAPASQVDDDVQTSYPLVVHNRSDFQVVVYSMASPWTRGMRLGEARALHDTYLKIPTSALQSNGVLAVQLHAIGSTPSTGNWTSMSVRLDPDLMGQLDIYADHRGDMRMSSLSTRIATIR